MSKKYYCDNCGKECQSGCAEIRNRICLQPSNVRVGVRCTIVSERDDVGTDICEACVVEAIATVTGLKRPA